MKREIKELVKRLRESSTVQRINRSHSIEILPSGDKLTLRIQLLEDRDIAETIKVPVNSKGFVDVETTLDLIVEAFQAGLEYPGPGINTLDNGNDAEHEPNEVLT